MSDEPLRSFSLAGKDSDSSSNTADNIPWLGRLGSGLLYNYLLQFNAPVFPYFRSKDGQTADVLTEKGYHSRTNRLKEEGQKLK